MMRTTVKARNLDLSDRLRSQIEHKLRRLDRIAHPDADATVELTVNASHSSEMAHVAEVMLVTNGTLLRSTAAGPTLMAAIDTVIDKLERQVVRARQRPRSVRERQAEEAMEPAAVAAGEDDEAADDEAPGDPGGGHPKVVKIKRFDMVPMFEEDAVARMEELGHGFFVFLNAETDGIGVIYRRSDGSYGLIEPVLGTSGRTR
jgi:putative sigma-54 modulation protein